MTDTKIHSLKRPAIERMLQIHQALKSGKKVNCRTLSEEMEVSTKTIARDIDFMRDRMLLPIEYEKQSHCYRYEGTVESLPTIDISEGELLALSIAQKAMDHYKGTPFEKPLSNALNKLAASLPDNLTANLDQLSESISFRQSATTHIDEATLKSFTQAALKRKAIRFDYKKLGSSESEQRTLQIYHLTNFLGKWYAIGKDEKRDAIRTFLLNRASNATITQLSFKTPNSFSADDYLGSSFGIYSPEGEHQVAIKFLSPIAEYVTENIWHPSQSVERGEDGTATIRFKLGGFHEVKPWILSWGRNAEALAPDALREELKEEAQRVAALYR